MKTHELAKALEFFASILRSGPNVALEEAEVRKVGGTENMQEIAVNLSTLSRLSQIDKKEWLTFVEMYKIPIEIRPRDASRDIIGKLLKYLEANPQEHERIQKPKAGETSESSPELMKALSILLKGTKQ